MEVWGRLEKEHGGGCWKLLEVGEGRKLEEDETHWTREEVGGWLRLESGGGRRRLEEEGGGGWRMAEDRGWCLEETGGGWRRLEEFTMKQSSRCPRDHIAYKKHNYLAL